MLGFCFFQAVNFIRSNYFVRKSHAQQTNRLMSESAITESYFSCIKIILRSNIFHFNKNVKLIINILMFLLRLLKFIYSLCSLIRDKRKLPKNHINPTQDNEKRCFVVSDVYIHEENCRHCDKEE